jgi:adenosylmethionine-8-amino-7-oxononanoate aminotransferase
MTQQQTKTKPRSNEARRRAAYLKYRLSPRARDLFDDLISQRGPGPHGTFAEAMTLRTAELIASAERVREELNQAKSPTAAQITAVVRIEGVARRAIGDLAKAAPPRSEEDAELDTILRRYRGEPEEIDDEQDRNLDH